MLVVDDQRNMRATTAMMLRERRLRGRRGGGRRRRRSSAIGREAYDVVLTDLRMGRGTGSTCCARRRGSRPRPQVIVMTAYGTIECAVEAMRLGAYDYIQKPFKEDELLAAGREGARASAGCSAR